MKKKLQTTTDDENHPSYEKGKSTECHVAPHAAKKDETMNHTTQTVNGRTTRPRPTHKTPTSKKKANQDADSNPSFDSVPPDELGDELEPWVDHTVRATHKVDDFHGSKWNHVYLQTAGYIGNEQE